MLLLKIFRFKFLAVLLLVASPCFATDDFLQPPEIVTAEPGAEYLPAARKFQGIPSLERAKKGRLWAVWYASPTGGEDANNYVVLVTSGDNGKSWTEASLIIDPDKSGPVRAFDPELWIDPTGRLWVFWAQAIGHDGTVSGVWSITTDNPEAASPDWSAPRRLTDGIMMCKPTVLSTGEWCLPASTWRKTDNSARMVISTDEGKTWKVRGAAHIPKEMRAFDEHMIVERKDDSLWMLIRSNTGTMLESISTDRGQNWTVAKPSAIEHPSARFFIRRLSSGNLLLVKHHETKSRNNLTALISQDDGLTWQGGLLLDERSTVSYPDGVQAADGTIYIIHDRNRTKERQIFLSVFDESALLSGKPNQQTRLKVLVSEVESSK